MYDFSYIYNQHLENILNHQRHMETNILIMKYIFFSYYKNVTKLKDKVVKALHGIIQIWSQHS